MDESYKLATRILVVYESKLPFGRPATFGERIEAITKTIEDLGLKEVGSANVLEIVRASVATA